jgi:hypothetical protein
MFQGTYVATGVAKIRNNPQPRWRGGQPPAAICEARKVIPET